MREIFLFRPVPELAHILIGLDGFVPQLEAVFRAFGADPADVEGSDYVVEMIEFQRAARRIGQADTLERRYELILVASVTAGRFQGRIDDLTVDIEQARILARNRLKVLQHAIDEAMVGVVLQIERIWNTAHEADGLFAEALEERVVASGL